MPTIKKCPTCDTRMLRLYEREREGYSSSKSKYWGYLWFCPDKHTVIVEHRKSETPETFELKEIVTDAST